MGRWLPVGQQRRASAGGSQIGLNGFGLDRRCRQTDVDQVQAATERTSRIEELTQSGLPEGDRTGSGCAGSFGVAGIGVEPRGHIDGQDGATGLFEQGDGVCDQALRASPDAGAQEGVNRGVRVCKGLPDGWKVFRRPNLFDVKAAPVRPVEIESGIACYVVCGCKEEDANHSAVQGGQAGDDKAVAAVVPLAAEEGDPAILETAQQIFQDAGHTPAGRFHQAIAGYAALDGPLVDAGHLPAGDKLGVGLPHLTAFRLLREAIGR